MDLRDQVSGTQQVMGAELRRQITEPGHQCRRLLRRQLPGHPELSEVPVTVLQSHAGLPRPAQAAQRHHLRSIGIGPR